MTLNEIAKEIGVVKYDAIHEDMLALYPLPEDKKEKACSMALIERLQERFNLFGQYFEAVKEAWLELEKDPLRKSYADAAGVFMPDHTYGECTKVPVPEPDGTKAGDLIQLFILLPSVEAAYEKYLERGFSPEEAKNLILSIYHDLNHTSQNVLGRPGYIAIYFRWDCLYLKAKIFTFGGLNYEFHKFKLAYILKNKKTGALLPLSAEQTLYKNGQIFGSAGASDEAGAIAATFEETEDAYVGFAAETNSVYNAEKKAFPKSEWELILQPGDQVIGIHIPKKTDLSPEAVTKSLAGAQEIAKKRFSDWQPKMFTCTSWMISPELHAVMKEGSRVLAFGDRYTRYPAKSNGKSVFTFVFPQSFKGTYEELPEDTSLMRELKKLYIAGDCIRNYSGVIEFEKE